MRAVLEAGVLEELFEIVGPRRDVEIAEQNNLWQEAIRAHNSYAHYVGEDNKALQRKHYARAIELAKQYVGKHRTAIVALKEEMYRDALAILREGTPHLLSFRRRLGVTGIGQEGIKNKGRQKKIKTGIILLKKTRIKRVTL